MSEAPHLWLGRPGQETLQRGIAHELAEQSADASHDRVIAPPCHACGEPVADKDWERHKYEKHAMNEMCQPYGKADSREVLFLCYSRAHLEQKLAIWRSKHPGLRLALAGEGSRNNGKLFFQRFRVLDQNGKAVQ